MSEYANRKPGGLAGALSLVTDVQHGEAQRALALTLNFFLLFTAYYTIKPIREALILSLENGAVIKSHASGFQALAYRGRQKFSIHGPQIPVTGLVWWISCRSSWRTWPASRTKTICTQPRGSWCVV